MSVTVRTIYVNQLYQLQVSNVPGDLEIIRYTYATGLITSNYLPPTAIAILQARWNLITSGISAGTTQNFASLLGNLILASDPGGEIPFYFAGGGGFNYVYASGLGSGDYFLNIGIPNSADLWLLASAPTFPI